MEFLLLLGVVFIGHRWLFGEKAKPSDPSQSPNPSTGAPVPKSKHVTRLRKSPFPQPPTGAYAPKSKHVTRPPETPVPSPDSLSQDGGSHCGGHECEVTSSPSQLSSSQEWFPQSRHCIHQPSSEPIPDLHDRSLVALRIDEVEARREWTLPSSPLPTLAQHGDDCWIPAGKPVSVQGYVIPGGMVYVGNQLSSAFGAFKADGVEPSLIRPRQPIDSLLPDRSGSTLDYWPSYSEFRPSARAAYLEWLADGAQSPDTNIGYVFLYYYGLERRLLVDVDTSEHAREERPVLSREILRLRRIYGNNGSFRRYSGGLLAFLALRDGFTVPLTQTHLLEQGVWNNPPSDVLIHIGRLVHEHQPIPAHLALAWLLADPESRLRTPATRCWEMFAKLFFWRYDQDYLEGMIIPPNKTLLKATYQPASGGFGHRIMEHLSSLPDVSALKKPMRAIREIAEWCMEELEPYSRLLGRDPERIGSLTALTLLHPVLLRAKVNEPPLEPLASALRTILGREEQVVVVAADLLHHWPLQETGRVSKKEAVAMAQLLGKLHVGLEPDIRFGPFQLKPNGKLCLFRQQLTEGAAPSQAFKNAAVTLHFAATMVGADGQVSQEEYQQLAEYLVCLDGLELWERRRLGAHLEWLLEERPRLSGLKSRLGALTVEQGKTIARFLMAIAGSDGHIDPAEIKILGNLYPLLHLDPASIHSDLHAFQAASRQPVMDGWDHGQQMPLMQPPTGVLGHLPVPGVQLDMRKVASTMANTEAVQRLLATIFVAEQDEPTPVTAPVVSASAEVALPGVPGLEGELLSLFHRLREQGTWARASYEILCAELALLPDGAMEAINEAAFVACGNPLVEGEDPITVNRDIVEEMIS